MSRARGRTAAGRARAATRRKLRVWTGTDKAPTPLVGRDHGDPVLVGATDVDLHPRTAPSNWTDAFLDANRAELERLALRVEIRPVRGAIGLALHPRGRVGAVPVRSPVTRKVVTGLLVKPRLGWAPIGRVLGTTGFRVEPSIGGSTLVPGSAREVPPWVLAGPVLARLAAFMEHMSRDFVDVRVSREQPRGRVDWNQYARRSVPSGRWQRFDCRYSDLIDDPTLLAALRWTLTHILRDLEPASDEAAGRHLLEFAKLLLFRLGRGDATRPTPDFLNQLDRQGLQSGWLNAAVQAMGWVSEERGLGGARTLDGLAWSLSIDALWEAWVESFLGELARRLGGRLSVGRRGETHRPLVWKSHLRTLGHLAPDFLLELPGRTVWVDAKYKDHLNRVCRLGWSHVDTVTRDTHRADVHQALAYATLTDASRVDTILAYPVAENVERPVAIADTAAGSRRLRVMLAGLPFGFAGASAQGATVGEWVAMLNAPP